MFREMYKNPNFIGAETTPPNNVTVVTEDGIECYKSKHITFGSEATIDKQMKQLKGTDRGKDKIKELPEIQLKLENKTHKNLKRYFPRTTGTIPISGKET